jgi:hypothetical protein
MSTQLEIVRAIMRPHFDAVQDDFVGWRNVTTQTQLGRLRKTKFVIDPEMHDTERHFAACRDDGMLIHFAPQIVDLPVETLVAIVAHEFGHAADHAYPAYWILPSAGPGKAQWLGTPPDTKHGRRWQRLWRERSPDQIEWAADGIAQAVTGRKLGYCGNCLIQCYKGGIERPAGLR